MMTTQIIADIIQTGMGLDEGRVVIYNQRRRIDPDKGMWITVGQMSVKPFGNNVAAVSTTEGMSEVLTQHMQEMISVDMMSYDTDALERLPELLGALASTYSQQAQEHHAMRIGVLPTGISDVSMNEASSMIYRMNVTLNVLRAYNSTKPIDYYDTFEPVDFHSETDDPPN